MPPNSAAARPGRGGGRRRADDAEVAAQTKSCQHEEARLSTIWESLCIGTEKQQTMALKSSTTAGQRGVALDIKSHAGLCRPGGRKKAEYPWRLTTTTVVGRCLTGQSSIASLRR